MEIYLESPSGEPTQSLDEKLVHSGTAGKYRALIYYGKPGPIKLSQEIYIDFIPGGNYVDSGVWKVLLEWKTVPGRVFPLAAG